MPDVAHTSVGRRNQSDRVKSRRRGNRGKGITVKHDRSDLHQLSEPTVCGSDCTAKGSDVNSGNQPDLAALGLKCSTTRTQTFARREFSGASFQKQRVSNTCQAGSNTELSELEHHALQEHTCLGSKPAPNGRPRQGRTRQAQDRLDGTS